MFMKRPQEKKARWSSGTVISVDGQRSYTVQDDTTGTQYSRDRVNIKSVPRSDPISTTTNFSSERREEASLPIEMPNATATTKPPKPKPKTPMKHSANNPSDSVETSLKAGRQNCNNAFHPKMMNSRLSLLTFERRNISLLKTIAPLTNRARVSCD